jgi:predicted AAA+ superfamily ATPase
MATNKVFIERQIHKLVKEHLKTRRISVITGMRRTGKTTIVKRVLEDINSSNKVYLDLQNVETRDFFKERNFDNILLSLENRFNINFKEKAYIAIDEIQLVPELPGIIKYLYDTYDIKFIITGSSSYYMKNLFTESLAGRKQIFELYPLTFGEFLDFKSVYHKDENLSDCTFNNHEYEGFKKYYEEYLEYGGFPEVVLEESNEAKKNLLVDILSSYINIDVESMSDFRKKEDYYSIVKVLAERVGSKIDYSKISTIIGISRQTLNEYMSFFEDTYLIKRIPVWTNNKDREIVKAKKLYFIDNGLLNILSDLSSGSKFENAIFNQLRHLGEIRYFSLKNGKEIDFIITINMKETIALEVKETPIEADNGNLEYLAGLAGVKNYRLIGRNQSPTFSDYIWGGSIR